MTILYRFAGLKDGSIVDALQLSKQSTAGGDQFLCMSCGERLVAKVRGSIRQPHFAHYPGAVCRPETYLHRLGKLVFAEEYRRCLAEDTPYEIELQHPRICRKFEDVLGNSCFMKEHEKKAYDLTKYFDQVKLEQRDGEFIPDLLLFNQDRPAQRMYVEIAVTHFLSEKKSTSSERIIEIPLDNEDDLQRIKKRRLTREDARFVNFNTDSELLTDSDCYCTDKKAFAFIVYKSGKCVLEESTLDVVTSKRRRLRDSIEYFRIAQVSDRHHDGRHRSKGLIFREAVLEADAEGFELRNCYLCVYQADNFSGEKGLPVFCKCFKKSCSSNEAVSCSAFRAR